MFAHLMYQRLLVPNLRILIFFFNDTATTEIYTLSLHDALPISPGTGWPEPGGFLPREALAILKGVAKEGIAAMEAVEVSPPYDISDITALIAVRAMVDVLATMVKHDRIGGKLGSSIC